MESEFISFGAWINRQLDRNDPIGDLSRYIFQDERAHSPSGKYIDDAINLALKEWREIIPIERTGGRTGEDLDANQRDSLKRELAVLKRVARLSNREGSGAASAWRRFIDNQMP